jgi:hypothetical protein
VQVTTPDNFNDSAENQAGPIHEGPGISSIRRDVAKEFKDWFERGDFSESEKVFPRFNKAKGASMLRRDLEGAGMEYVDARGKVADFHSLRHTFITNLQRAGVSPRVAQSLARHSTITLTMGTYTHIGVYDERAGIESLPRLPEMDSDETGATEVPIGRTGTDDLPVKTDQAAYKPAYKKLTKNADFCGQPLSTIGHRRERESSGIQHGEQGGKPLQLADLGSEKSPLSSTDTGRKTNGRCRIRTCDRLIKSQRSEGPKGSQTKDLSEGQESAYKPAYKKDPKTTENQGQGLPGGLAEIVAVWAGLPGHIRQAIMALVRINTNNKGGN